MAGKLKGLAIALQAEYGELPGGGEIAEYLVKRLPGEIAIDAAGRALDRLKGVQLPEGAFYSARVNLAPHPDDEANYKSLNGFSEVPTAPYKNPVSFGTGLMRLADNVENKQEVLSVAIRLAIPPRGFFAVHGDGLMAGPRMALYEGEVYLEGPRGGARKVSKKRVAKKEKTPKKRVLKKSPQKALKKRGSKQDTSKNRTPKRGKTRR